MPIMPDAMLLASGAHDQAQGTARAYALCLGASGWGEMRDARPSAPFAGLGFTALVAPANRPATYLQILQAAACSRRPAYVVLWIRPCLLNPQDGRQYATTAWWSRPQPARNRLAWE